MKKKICIIFCLLTIFVAIYAQTRYNYDATIDKALSNITSNLPPNSRIAIVQVSIENEALRSYIVGETEIRLAAAGYRIANPANTPVLTPIDANASITIGRNANVAAVLNIIVDGIGDLQRLRMRLFDTRTTDLIGAASEPLEASTIPVIATTTPTPATPTTHTTPQTTTTPINANIPADYSPPLARNTGTQWTLTLPQKRIQYYEDGQPVDEPQRIAVAQTGDGASASRLSAQSTYYADEIKRWRFYYGVEVATDKEVYRYDRGIGHHIGMVYSVGSGVMRFEPGVRWMVRSADIALNHQYYYVEQRKKAELYYIDTFANLKLDTDFALKPYVGLALSVPLHKDEQEEDILYKCIGGLDLFINWFFIGYEINTDATIDSYSHILKTGIAF